MGFHHWWRRYVDLLLICVFSIILLMVDSCHNGNNNHISNLYDVIIIDSCYSMCMFVFVAMVYYIFSHSFVLFILIFYFLFVGWIFKKTKITKWLKSNTTLPFRRCYQCVLLWNKTDSNKRVNCQYKVLSCY